MVRISLKENLDFDNESQESPHEHQQSLLLSRIITNVVCGLLIHFRCSFSYIMVGEAQRSNHDNE